MRKRLCYIHVGPHKTGTTSIQWFLQENRAQLLEHGYFVPESETRRGAHHALAERLAGVDIGEHRERLVAKSIRALVETSAEAVVISSEALEGILQSRQHADVFFGRIRELELEPKLILFPRNQPQWINSSYASSVQTFRRWDPFEDCPLRFAQSPGSKFSRWIKLADTHRAELIARPFSKETIARGVIPEFLRCIGITSSEFRDDAVRRNEAVGPFTVSVARNVLRSIEASGKRLTWLQARQCKTTLAEHLAARHWTDVGYCGLSTTLARRIEAELQCDNDSFAQHAWGKAWREMFPTDISQEFTPNDFDLCKPSWLIARRLRRAVRYMNARVQEILFDPALSIDAPWNDLAQRSGLVLQQ